MRKLLSLSERPTAVFAASDVLAMGALAVKTLVEMIRNGSQYVRRHSLDTGIVVRKSCRAFARS